MWKITYLFNILVLSAIYTVAFSQTTIASWTFDAENTTPNVVAGTITLIGGTTSTYATGVTSGTINATTGVGTKPAISGPE